MAQQEKVAVGDMTVTQAQAALEAAEEAQDAAMIALEKARVDREMAQADVDAVIAREANGGAVIRAIDAQNSFAFRLMEWMSGQPDVADVQGVGLGFVGFRLAGAGDMSLSYNRTGYSPGE